MINWPIEQPTLRVQLGESSVILRPLREEDIDPINAACQDPTISAFTRVPYPYDRELAEQFVRGCDLGYRNHQGVVFGIEYNQFGTSTFAGTIGLHSINISDHCTEVGYWLEKSHRGHGIATAALNLVTDLALDVMAFRRIEALTDFDNLASQSVITRSGYEREALLRNRVTKPDGSQKDMVLFARVLDS
jgi:RimJ/RimL family protein N-acetyltransferase